MDTAPKGLGDTKPTASRSGETELAPKGSGETEPTTKGLGEPEPVTKGSGEPLFKCGSTAPRKTTKVIVKYKLSLL